MKKSRLLKLSSLMLAGVVAFSGCGGDTTKTTDDTNKPADNGAIKFEVSVKNEGTPVEGADPIVIGNLSADPIKGQFNPIFYLDAADYEVMKYTMCGAFPTDEQFALKQDDEEAPFKFHLDNENKTKTITVHKDLKWSNGEPVTADDIMGTYLLMGNPKFEDNIRYDESFETIVGMKEYHEGTADNISGMTKVDDRTVEFKLTEVTPAMQWGDGGVPEFLNAKQIEKITDFTKFWEAELNTKPLSYGPYYLDKNNNGESQLFKANPYYYKGEPKNKELKFVIVPPSQLIEKLKSGEVDYMTVSSTYYDEISKLTNGKLLGENDLYMAYIGFKLGKFDKEKGQVIPDPNAKLADINLRKAMAMALDNDTVNKTLFKGIGSTPTGSGLFPPIRKGIYNENVQKIPFDVEGAKKLLDENGYKDVDGDGLRENKDGSKLEIRLAQRDTGNAIDEPLSQFYLKSFKDIGLDVKLTDDKLIGVKDWSQRVQADDPTIDIYYGAWGLGSDPNPVALLGPTSPLNLYRIKTDNLDKAFASLNTKENLDRNNLLKAYQNIDKEIANELPYIPVRWTKALLFVNNRIGELNISSFAEVGLQDQFANTPILSKTPIASK